MLGFRILFGQHPPTRINQRGGEQVLHRERQKPVHFCDRFTGTYIQPVKLIPAGVTPQEVDKDRQNRCLLSLSLHFCDGWGPAPEADGIRLVECTRTGRRGPGGFPRNPPFGQEM